MIIISDIVLVIRNARDKVQVARYILEQDGNDYTIKRHTGQFQGKFTDQPEIKIEKGKAKRSVLQQAELEYNSLIKKTCDKGYKKLSTLTKTKFEDITLEEINQIVPSLKTDSNGVVKPQLAKSSNDCSINVHEKPRYVSRKLDGVRCLLRKDGSSSRGGGDYDIVTEHIRNTPGMIELFEKYPDLILDGELYVHGWPLQKISGTCRLKTHEERCNKIEYWIYDIADSEKIFEQRLDFMMFKLCDYFEDSDPIKIVEHKRAEGWAEVKKLHDKYVNEGFEGLVSRHPEKKYQFGKRNSDWIKVKDYQSDEFEITGIERGLRDEDMCFTLKTKKGKSFKAKPVGDRELKLEYLDNWPNYVGLMGTVTYFAISEDGIPTQPVFRSIRPDGE